MKASNSAKGASVPSFETSAEGAPFETSAEGAPFETLNKELASASWLAEGDWLSQLEASVLAFEIESALRRLTEVTHV